MKVNQLVEATGFKVCNLSDGDRKVDGVYCGDLLSWVMGRAQAQNVWITIMSNLNVVAVASLTDVSCVLLAEDVVLDENAAIQAKLKGINVLSSPLPIYETATRLAELLK